MKSAAVVADPIRIDRFRERVEVDAKGPDKVIGQGLEPLYVIADDPVEAHVWAQRHKPGRALKFGSTLSELPAQGLYLKDVPVYVLRPMRPEVRDAWLRTGAKLVYL